MARSIRNVPPIDLSGYPALNFEGLELRANYRFISFREDVLYALDRREAAAIIIQILLRWHEYLRDDLLEKIEQRHKEGQPPFTPDEIEERMWVYMSYTRFVRETGGALGYNTVIRTLDYLVEEKKVVERRANQHPNTADYADYEYRINRIVLRDLLKMVPVYPQRSSTKKGKPAQATTACQNDLPGEGPSSAQTGTLPTHVGTPLDGVSHDEAPPTHVGTECTHVDTSGTHLGTASYPDGQTIQITLQDSPQESLQQQMASDPIHEPQVAAAGSFSEAELGILSADEIALIQAHRRRCHQEQRQSQLPVIRADSTPELEPTPVSPSVGAPPATAPGHSNQPSSQPATHACRQNSMALVVTDAVAVSQASTSSGPHQAQKQETLHPLTDVSNCKVALQVTLSAETMVALVEHKLGKSYDTVAKARQLSAARQVLELKLLPDLSTLERVYDASYDDWWKQHHGEMHLTDLLEREKSGQPRIVRLLARLPSAPGPVLSSEPRPGPRDVVGTQKRDYVPDPYVERRKREAIEEMLLNGEQYLEQIRASSPQEAERFAAALHLLRKQQGGMVCNA